ncbi:hypothetical protein GCL57_02730 [Fluviispira multicolorata]|uniref:Solute-binding protein family 5 domain-containing protein n=2 Tax=Fluviispira multicolorata TaxID=2654512 RepID=A0A833N6L6_9BACT|nr:hypothetical protein GCL57_02730 [Fluviispira multicolorata]
MKKLFKIFLFIFFIQCKSLYGEKMKKDEIVFYSAAKSENPWIENAPGDLKNVFHTAILNLLVYMDTDFNIKPITLESFHWDYKNKYYVLTLKPDLYFTNGRKVTIEDLEFSLLRPFFAAAKNVGSMRLINVKGIEKIKLGTLYQSGLVEGIKILSSNSLAVIPSSPNPSFMYTLARSNYSLRPKEEFKKDLLNWKKWPIGVGPYKITNEDKENRKYTLELVNHNLLKDAPRKIIFELERISKPDITLKDPISSNDSSFKHIELSAPLGVRLFAFNYTSKLGNNAEFRKAINLSLKRNLITKETLIPSIPLNEVVTKGSIGRLNIVENQDLIEAKRLFKKVLGNQIDRVFKIPHTPDSDFLGNSYKTVIIKQLEMAGLKIEFIESNNLWNTFQDEFSDSPFRMLGKGADYYDPLMTFTMFKKGSPLINSYPNDDTLDTLMEEAKISPNRDILGLSIEKLSKYFTDNDIAIHLFSVPTIVHYNPQKIKSVGEQVGGQTFHLAHITMK